MGFIQNFPLPKYDENDKKQPNSNKIKFKLYLVPVYYPLRHRSKYGSMSRRSHSARDPSEWSASASESVALCQDVLMSARDPSELVVGFSY
jgi:hypothetical protein